MFPALRKSSLRLYIGRQRSILMIVTFNGVMITSYMIISITFKDGMMLRFMFTASPAFQAGWTRLLILDLRS